jgi:hypothetical protein
LRKGGTSRYRRLSTPKRQDKKRNIKTVTIQIKEIILNVAKEK